MSNDAPTQNSEKFESMPISFKHVTEISTAFAVPICHFRNEKELSRVNFHKDFCDCYRGQGKQLDQ